MRTEKQIAASRGNGMVFWDMCPVCRSPAKAWGVKVTESGSFHIARCVSCGFAFVNNRPSYLMYTRYYEQCGHHTGTHVADSGSGAASAEVLERERAVPNSTIDARRIVSRILAIGGWLSVQTEHPRLLDVGCGYGFFSREAERQGFAVTSLEPAERERKIGTAIIGKEPIAARFEDYDAPNGSFDAILMSQVLEHAWDPNAWLEKARRLLATGGIVAIALPSFGSVFRIVLGVGDPYICPPGHLNFFDRRAIGVLLEKHGFRARTTQCVTRVPLSSVTRRVRLARHAAPLLKSCLKWAGAAVDALGVGMMINVYGEKR